MSDVRRRLAKLGGQLDQTGVPPRIRALTTAELSTRLAAAAEQLRRRAASPLSGLDIRDLGPPSPRYAHLSDDALLAQLALAKAELAASQGRTP